jgi:hypothetical protein
MQNVIFTFAYLMAFVWGFAILWALSSAVLNSVNWKMKASPKTKLAYKNLVQRLKRSYGPSAGLTKAGLSYGKKFSHS